MSRDDLRSYAIIAHVDHGKTTLVDALLHQSGVFREHQEVLECYLDQGDLERERGITILSKCIAISYGGRRINLIDTPGHSDFGGEVERVLKLADGVLLLVDSHEGPMPQTRFVLQKALELRLPPVVVINKMDRRDARPAEVLEEIQDLILELAVDDSQLDFPVLYASGRAGRAGLVPEELAPDLRPLLDTMVSAVPGPALDEEGPLQILVAAFEHSDFVGRIAIGRITRGLVREGQRVLVLRPGEAGRAATIRQVELFEGLGRVRVQEARAGDVAALVGLEGISIGDTITHPEHPVAVEAIAVEAPTISMVFHVNDSPLRGEEGEHLTSRKLRERLHREAEADVALRVEDATTTDAFHVSGRGVLHLGILVERLRREGYEFCVSRPQVILREGRGEVQEPYEEAIVETPPAAAGKVMGLLGQRRGELVSMEERGDRQRLRFDIPSRGLMGLRTQLLTLTQGEATLVHRFLEYRPWRGPIQGRASGVQVADRLGRSTAYALCALQDRGPQYVGPQTMVYEGMIVGEHCHESDLVVNVCREKQLTNFRAAGADRHLLLAPPVTFSVEEALEYLEDDELLEVTPHSLRMRKRILNARERKRDADRQRLAPAVPRTAASG